VYFGDGDSGLWRSTDAGQTWSSIWSASALGSRSLRGLAGDPQRAGRLYVSLSDGVYQLDSAATGASVGSGITSTQLGTFSNPGPVAFDSAHGRLYATGKLSGGLAPRFAYWDTATSTWLDRANAVYRGAFGDARGIAVAGDGSIYVAFMGNGVLRAP
jgi:hypothetical protein